MHVALVRALASSSPICLDRPSGSSPSTINAARRNGYLRRLLVVGAKSVTRRAATINTQTGAWVRSLLERKPARLVTVAIANKTARTAWALLAREESYRAIPAS